jgi:hypothetical protein
MMGTVEDIEKQDRITQRAFAMLMDAKRAEAAHTDRNTILGVRNRATDARMEVDNELRLLRKLRSGLDELIEDLDLRLEERERRERAAPQATAEQVTLIGPGGRVASPEETQRFLNQVQGAAGYVGQRRRGPGATEAVYAAGHTFNPPGQAPMPQTFRPPPPPPRRAVERAGELQQEALHREELIRANARSVPPPQPNFDSDRNRKWRREHGG